MSKQILKVAITGAYGFLGTYLSKYLSNKFKLFRIGHNSGRIRCNLLNKNDTQSLFKSINPDLVIHTVAETDVDKSEKFKEIAIEKNFLTTKHLLECIPETTKIIYISTDQVYPNEKLLHEEINVAPVNNYGKSKLLAEHEIRKRKNHLILRTNFFGSNNKNKKSSLSDFITQNLKSKKDFYLFKDVFFNPLHVTTLSKIIKTLISCEVCGTYNVGSKGVISKYEFGKKISQLYNYSMDKAVSIASSEIMDRAPRSLYLTMNVSKIERELNIKMPSIIQEINKLKVK